MSTDVTFSMKRWKTLGGEELCREIPTRIPSTRLQMFEIVMTGISQLPRRDRANEMCFNCTLLTVVRRSLSSISVHHSHKTLSFLSHFQRLCKRHEREIQLERDVTPPDLIRHGVHCIGSMRLTFWS